MGGYNTVSVTNPGKSRPPDRPSLKHKITRVAPVGKLFLEFPWFGAQVRAVLALCASNARPKPKPLSAIVPRAREAPWNQRATLQNSLLFFCARMFCLLSGSLPAPAAETRLDRLDGHLRDEREETSGHFTSAAVTWRTAAPAKPTQFSREEQTHSSFSRCFRTIPPQQDVAGRRVDRLRRERRVPGYRIVLHANGWSARGSISRSLLRSGGAIL